MQVQALITAVMDMFACPAFIVHAFQNPSSSTAEGHHGLDGEAINGVFTALLKVHALTQEVKSEVYMLSLVVNHPTATPMSGIVVPIQMNKGHCRSSKPFFIVCMFHQESQAWQHYEKTHLPDMTCWVAFERGTRIPITATMPRSCCIMPRKAHAV